jgi:hypothetical protein
MSHYFTSFKGRQDVPQGGAVQPVIPNAYLPSGVGRCVNGKSKLVSIASNNGSSSSASGMLYFNIPSNLGYLKPGSTYVKFQFSATTTGAAAYGFNMGVSRSAASLFNRVSLSVGGNQVEVINNYNVFQDLLLSHASTRDYVNYDASITEGTTRTNFASGTTYFLTVPISSSILQNAKGFPLFMTQGGLNLQIDLETAARAVKSGLTYTITNAILCCDVMQVDNNLQQELRNELISNERLYEIPMVSVQALQTNRAIATDLNYIAGVNLMSLLSVFWAEITVGVDTGTDQKLILNPMSAANDAVAYDRQLLIDGVKQNSFAIQSNAQVYQELQRCLGCITDGKITSFTDYQDYPTQSFWNAISCAKVDENDCVMRGTPVNSLQLILNSNGQNPAASNCYIFMVYDSVLTISPSSGLVSVAK